MQDSYPHGTTARDFQDSIKLESFRFSRELRIEITETDYDTDNYHDGDPGPVVASRDASRKFGDAYDTDDAWGNPLTPVQWAINVLRPMAAFEPSSWPIQDEEPEFTWLSSWQSFDPATSIETDISVRLTGDWTDRERSEVFRGTTQREAPKGYPF